MNKTICGERIGRIREYMGYSQSDFADRVEIILIALCKNECGDKTPSLDVFVKICWALDVMPPELVGV